MTFRADLFVGDAILFLIFALANFRISSLLVEEYGIFGIFEHIRERIGVDDAAPSGRVNQRPVGDVPDGQPNQLAGLFSCIYCMSVWVGFFQALAFYFVPQEAYWLQLPLALSGAAIVLYKVSE